MAVKIRLKRMGSKKRPFYRVVVADSRSPRDGRFIEEIGYYNPISSPVELSIDTEKAKKWLGNGAQPTDRARLLLKEVGVLSMTRYEEEYPQQKTSNESSQEPEKSEEE